MFAVAVLSQAASVLVQAELGPHLVERVHIVRVRLVVSHGLPELLAELLERMPGVGLSV